MHFLEYTFVLDTYCQRFVIVCLTHGNVIFVILETPAHRKYSTGLMLYLCISVFVYFYICALNTWEYHFWHPGTTCFANKDAMLKDTQVGYTSNQKVWAHTPQPIFWLKWTIGRKNSFDSFLLNFCPPIAYIVSFWVRGTKSASNSGGNFAPLLPLAPN